MAIMSHVYYISLLDPYLFITLSPAAADSCLSKTRRTHRCILFIRINQDWTVIVQSHPPTEYVSMRSPLVYIPIRCVIPLLNYFQKNGRWCKSSEQGAICKSPSRLIRFVRYIYWTPQWNPTFSHIIKCLRSKINSRYVLRATQPRLVVVFPAALCASKRLQGRSYRLVLWAPHSGSFKRHCPWNMTSGWALSTELTRAINQYYSWFRMKRR